MKIIGLGKGIPKKILSNDELSTIVDTNDEWITTRTGIKNRHVCTDESLTDLAETAAAEALKNANITADEIDMIICATIGGDYTTPSLACCVAERLGTSCAAFDINAACTGFLYALDIAEKYLTQDKSNVLIISAEVMSKRVDWQDRRTCVLFGDGAGACVATKGDSLKYLNLTVQGDSKTINSPIGTGNSPFISEQKESGFLYMDGQEVFKFAVSTAEKEVALALEALNLSTEDIDMFVLHQANKRIIDFARKRLKQPEEKFPVSVDRYGNTSAASIPILLCELVEEGKIKAGDRLFMCAFGAGMTAGSCVLIWE